MKRGLTVVLAVLMIMSLFVACKNTEGAPTVSDEKAAETATELSSLKTFGDLLALEGAEMQGSSSGEKFFVYVFRYKDVYWRALVEMSEETREAYFNIDFFDPDREQKENEILAPLTIYRLDNLNDEILSEDECNAWVGKTGEELLNSGWKTGMGYNLDEATFFLAYKSFEYAVVFEAEGIPEITDESGDFDETAAIRSLKVKSVTYSHVSSNATDIPENEPTEP